MGKLSTAMVRPVLQTMYEHRKEMVPCFIGAPGIGKTQGIYEFAKEIGVKVVTFILSNTVPSEVSGVRMPDEDTKKLEVFDDSRMASLKDGDILFFDEILEADPMLWSACLTLIQDRILASGNKLPDVFIVAASNPVASPAVIPASVRDRFQFIELYFDKEHWRKWFKGKFDVDPDDILPYIKEDSDQYNILTPRRVVKLYTWLNNGEHEGEVWNTKLEIIRSEFDTIITSRFVRLINQVPPFAKQVEKALEKDGIHVSLTDMDDKDILEFLQAQPEWDEIKLVLENVEFVENKNEEVCQF